MKKIILAFLTFYLFTSCSNDDEKDQPICYSPSQNLEIAYNDNSIGCSCDSKVDNNTCIKDKNGRKVALICNKNQWDAVEDGPCFIPPKSQIVNIRLFNNSEFDFTNATFNGVNFGNLKTKNRTDYIEFINSYRYGSVSITIEGEKYGWTPIDFVGEEFLENGNYTFEYKFDNETKKLTDTLIKE